MRKIYILFIFFLVFFLGACRQQKKEEPLIVQEDSAIKMLEIFYKIYINENSKHVKDTDYEKIELLKKKYVTPILLKKIEKLDYDPFVKGQDYDSSWINNLTILQINPPSGQYNVCLHKNHCIKVSVIKQKSGYKINDLDIYSEPKNNSIQHQIFFEYNSKKYNYKIIADEPENSKIIEILDIDKNLIQRIDFISEVNWKNHKTITKKVIFPLEKETYETDFGVEIYCDFVIADYNFDDREDFAIINSEGGNGGPSYSYFIQNYEGKFELDNNLTNNMRLFPVEINNKEKSLKISHPSGCCKTLTYKIQLQNNGEWKEIFYELKEISSE